MVEAAGAWNREIQSGARFTFGDNWTAFLRILDDERIRAAEDSLKTKLTRAIVLAPTPRA